MFKMGNGRKALKARLNAENDIDHCAPLVLISSEIV